MSTVYCSIKVDSKYIICNARKYQTESYIKYMTSSKKKDLNYNNNNIVFNITSFYDEKKYKFDYSSFCFLINDKKEKHILSNNKTILQNYINNNNNDTNRSKISVVSYQKNIMNAPPYAYIINNINDNGFTYQPEDRYQVVWFKGQHNLFSIDTPLDVNRVEFNNENMFGGCVRIHTNTNHRDHINESFAYIYYPLTKELYCLALNASEARFGGIVISPNYNHPLVKKYERIKFLMNKLKRLAPIIGKWALFFNQLYTEITYRPNNLGANEAIKRLKNY